jgi:hypothetical protein
MCDIHGSLGKAFGKKGLGEMCASNGALEDELGVTENPNNGIAPPKIYEGYFNISQITVTVLNQWFRSHMGKQTVFWY